ncbi:MAG: hypothetical protein B7Z52_07920 [Burkholderiales bacterium 12-64-5]|nr:MAG: hypothetical protein B7Z52_07920 [Burkholderiales bacterium 12-64-5]
MDKMFRLLKENREIADPPGAQDLVLRGAKVSFEHVDFFYDAKRQILHDVSFEIGAGKTVAVVGTSGSGKSTLARLLYRFYDVQRGRVTIDGQDFAMFYNANFSTGALTGGHDLMLSAMAPEPSRALLSLLGLSSLLLKRRRLR